MNIHLSLPATLLLLCCGCEPPASAEKSPHPLAGAWQADDGTIFDFRPDHTFHGIDWKEQEIWGTWVHLSGTRIGFQSLLHQSFYRPQYAIIRDGDTNRMDYIISDGNNYISARRIPVEKARAAIELLTGPKVVPPPSQ